MLPRAQVVHLILLLKKPVDPSIAFGGFDRLLEEVHNFKKNARLIIENNDYVFFYFYMGKTDGNYCFDYHLQESHFNLQNYVKYEPKIATTEPTILPLKEQEGNEFVLV